jgi:hypothetical protein
MLSRQGENPRGTAARKQTQRIMLEIQKVGPAFLLILIVYIQLEAIGVRYCKKLFRTPTPVLYLPLCYTLCIFPFPKPQIPTSRPSLYTKEEDDLIFFTFLFAY